MKVYQTLCFLVYSGVYVHSDPISDMTTKAVYHGARAVATNAMNRHAAMDDYDSGPIPPALQAAGGAMINLLGKAGTALGGLSLRAIMESSSMIRNSSSFKKLSYTVSQPDIEKERVMQKLQNLGSGAVIFCRQMDFSRRKPRTSTLADGVSSISSTHWKYGVLTTYKNPNQAYETLKEILVQAQKLLVTARSTGVLNEMGSSINYYDGGGQPMHLLIEPVLESYRDLLSKGLTFLSQSFIDDQYYELKHFYQKMMPLLKQAYILAWSLTEVLDKSNLRTFYQYRLSEILDDFAEFDHGLELAAQNVPPSDNKYSPEDDYLFTGLLTL